MISSLRALEAPLFSSMGRAALFSSSASPFSPSPSQNAPFRATSSFGKISLFHSLSSHVMIIPRSIRQEADGDGRVLSLNENVSVFQGDHKNFNESPTFPKESVTLFHNGEDGSSFVDISRNYQIPIHRDVDGQTMYHSMVVPLSVRQTTGDGRILALQDTPTFLKATDSPSGQESLSEEGGNSSIDGFEESEFGHSLESVKRKRRAKMNRHKYRKRLKKLRFLRRKLGR